jgi:hypothetical protein
MYNFILNRSFMYFKLHIQRYNCIYNIFFFIKHYQILIVCLVSLISIALAFSNKIHTNQQIQQGMKRLINVLNHINIDVIRIIDYTTCDANSEEEMTTVSIPKFFDTMNSKLYTSNKLNCKYIR